MNLATLAWPKQASDLRIGAAVAHTSLIEASLEKNEVQGLGLFIDGLDGATTTLEADDQVSKLRSRFGGWRVQRLPLLDLPNYARSCPTVFIAGGPSTPAISGMRAAIDPALFPICSVVHSLCWDNLMSLYCYAWMLNEHQDCLVATSEAAEIAIAHILDQVDELICHRFGPSSDRIPRPRVVRGRLGVSTANLTQKSKAQCRADLDLPHAGSIFLYLGRLSQTYKADLDPLLLAFCEVTKTVRGASLVIAGNQHQKGYVSHLLEMGSSLGIADSLHFLCNFEDERKSVLYRAADVFVSPVDNVQETFGLSLLEAMSHGVPVIASDWSGYRDIVEHNVTGLLIPTLWLEEAPNPVNVYASVLRGAELETFLARRTMVDVDQLTSAMIMLAENPALAKHLGDAGREHVAQRFAWDAVVLQYGALWKEQCHITQARVKQANNPTYHLIDYDQTFSHYASATQQLRDVAFIVSRTDSNIEARICRTLSALAPALATRIETILMKARDTTGLSYIGNDTPSSREAIRWVLKKGLARAVTFH